VLASSLNPAPTGTNVTFTATVTAVFPGNGTPTNQVRFLTNGVWAALVNLNATTQAAYATSLLPHGTDTVTAEYLSDGSFLASTGSVTQLVNTSPKASALTLGAVSGLPATLRIIGGPNAPTDADHDPLTVTGAGTPSHGTASTDGTNVIYIATDGFAGSDSFTYTVGDGYGGTATNSVAVSVIANSADLNRMFAALSGEDAVLTYLGIPGNNYALERTFNLTPPEWLPIVTNPARANGYVMFTNLLQPGTNNFWRTRQVP
jgi:hypothetical protein